MSLTIKLCCPSHRSFTPSRGTTAIRGGCPVCWRICAMARMAAKLQRRIDAMVEAQARLLHMPIEIPRPGTVERDQRVPVRKKRVSTKREQPVKVDSAKKARGR